MLGTSRRPHAFLPEKMRQVGAVMLAHDDTALVGNVLLSFVYGLEDCGWGCAGFCCPPNRILHRRCTFVIMRRRGEVGTTETPLKLRHTPAIWLSDVERHESELMLAWI